MTTFALRNASCFLRTVLLYLALSSFSLAGTGLTYSPAVIADQTTYEGIIKSPSGQAIPITLILWHDNNAAPGVGWHGAFSLANEAGPYPIEDVVFSQSTDTVILTYKAARKRAVWWTTLNGHPGVALTGLMESLYGNLGIVQLTPVINEESSRTPYIAGTWSGSCTYTGQADHPAKLFILNLSPSPERSQPTRFLPWFPQKFGSFFLDDKQIYSIGGSNGCKTDYLDGTVDCIALSTKGCKTVHPLLGSMNCPPATPEDKANLHGEFNYKTREFKIEIDAPSAKISCERLQFKEALASHY